MDLIKIDSAKKELFRNQDHEKLEQIKAFQVVDSVSMDMLASIVVALKEMKKERDAFYKPYLEQAQEAKRQAEKTRKMIDTDYAAAVAPLEECISLANRKNQAFLDEERRKAQEKARIEQERIRAEEEAKKLAEAEKLAAEGKSEEADKVLDDPIVEPVVEVKEVAKPQGYREVTYWRAEVVDFSKLPDDYKLTNQVALNKVAVALKDKAKVEGVRFYADTRPY